MSKHDLLSVEGTGPVVGKTLLDGCSWLLRHARIPKFG
jgi:hypothetical protein